MLNIKKTGNDETLLISLEGKLDTVTAQDLDASIKEDIDGLKELVFDMSGLKYISSAGLRVLLGTQKIMSGQGKMKIIKPNEIIQEIFEDTGFYNILTIEK